ncbi:MAG: ABC transporter substrate-binding protein [Candidatus Paceibacterota bacterium]
MFSRFVAILTSLSGKERRVLSISASVFFVSLIVLFLNIYFFGTQVVPQSGGVFVEGAVGQPSAINPVLGSSQEIDRDLVELMFARLSDLSESIERSEDGREWRVLLKEGLFWSDGEPLTIDDVIFTIGLIQNRELASPLLSSWRGVDVVKTSGNEVLITLETPYRYFATTLDNLRPIPAHIFSGIPVANIRLSSYNLSPVSSGPFRFDSMEQKKDGFINTYSMVRNENFSLASPYLKGFEFRFFNRFKDAVAAFNRGFIDGLGGFDPLAVEDIVARHELFEISIPRYYAIFMNGSSQPALKELAVRTVLARYLDKEKLIKDTLDSSATAIDGPIPSYIEGFDEEIYKDSSLSRSQAKSLLEEAGFELNDEDIYAKEDLTLTFNLIVPDIDFLSDSARFIAQEFSEVGIRIEPIVLSSSVISSEIIRSRDYDLILFGNVLRGNADVFSFWHSSQRFYPGLNLSLYEDNEVDSALELSRSTFDDEKFSAALSTIQQKIYDDAAASFLFSPIYSYAVGSDVKGVEFDTLTNSSDRFAGAEGWYKKQKRVLR